MPCPNRSICLHAGVVVLKDIDVLVSSRTICGKLVAMFVETAVQLAYGIGCRLFVRFALTACTGIVKYGVEHIHILLYAGRFIVVRCPAGREAHFGFQRHHRLANLSFLVVIRMTPFAARDP